MMSGLSKGNRIAVIFVVLMFIFGLFGLCCSCSGDTKKFRIYGAECTFKGHQYIVFQDQYWGNIAVVHSEDCPCWIVSTDVDNK